MNDVKYLGETGRYAWPVPFGGANAVVSIIDETGRERLLTANRDYLIMSDHILCQCPAGSIIHIFESDQARAARAALAGSPIKVNPEPASLASDPCPGYPGASQSEARAEADSSALDALLDRKLRAMEESVAQYDDTLRKVGSEAEKKVFLASAEAKTALQAGADLLLAKCEAIYKECFREAARISSWAVQISQYHNRPGVSAVKSEAEIPGSARGLIIVNPHITHSPTPFMGVWPIRDLCEAQWEGLFFLGHPYDGPLTPPPPFPVCPPLSPEKAKGDGDDWVPCDHGHAIRPCRPPRPPAYWGPRPGAYPPPPCHCQDKSLDDSGEPTNTQDPN